MKITETHIYFQSGYDYLARTHYAPFKYKEKQFFNCEQFLFYCKAKLAQQDILANLILKEPKPTNLKQYKNKIRLNTKQKKMWNKNRDNYALIATREKFLQNPQLLENLLNTEDKKFVEATTFGTHWCAGLNINDPKILSTNKWKGRNNYGKILTFLRNELKLGNYHNLNANEGAKELMKKKRQKP
jgi:ribA/ribD-fused uncharacterized protein